MDTQNIEEYNQEYICTAIQFFLALVATSYSGVSASQRYSGLFVTRVLMYLVCMCVCAQVWRVEDLELVPVDPEWYGYFYGGDCYLILYTYLVNNRKSYLLYIWQVSWCQKCAPLTAPGLALRIISVLLKGN